MKRKLDDVMKKLEVLYDRLRDGTVSGFKKTLARLV
jgi:hypothetical protein